MLKIVSELLSYNYIYFKTINIQNLYIYIQIT